MYLLLVILSLSAAYGYWFFSKKTQPAIATTAQVSFESIVPLAGTEEMELSFEQQEEQFDPVLVEEDETILLIEAEKLMDEIQAIAATNHDVYGKLKKHLSGFNLFYNTDYQEAMNRFIAATVKNECNLELSASELAALWN